MTRKELTYAIGGIAGAVAGAGCAATLPSQALPERPNGKTIVPSIVYKAAPVPATLSLAVGGYPNTFVKQETTIRARSSDESVCRVADTGQNLHLQAQKRGTCTIHFEDPTNGDAWQMTVNCV